ncbi:Dicarboxylate carrier protein MatC N-terminus [Oligella ureolytica]|uniref:SLC13 family permease n=1 Tax=Oligella ureolytica TaxID=90244 RepID=UPI000E060CCE|nr:SLC13 family permease [Oligella ureolytica]SUA59080.1 Dicarboxylate carrier protein MatC N-terminus [Oligella ureolytica]
MTLIIMIAILLAIAIGYKTKINIGLFAIVFAYLIGSFGLDLTASQVVNFWPIKIFFIIFAVTLFYNVAMVNGALEKLASHLLYACRNFPIFLPLAIFASATVIAALGAGFYTVLAFMAPMTLLLCQKTGMSKIIGGMAVNYGALAGANFMTSQSGVIFRGIMEGVGVEPAQAFTNSTAIFVTTLIVPIVVIGSYLLFNHKKLNINITAEKPAPFDPKQKQSLILIITLMAVVLIIPILNLIMPHNHLISFLNSKVDIGFMAIIFAVISLLLKLADEKKVVAMVPWGTLIMICGVGMLIEVAIQAGVINELSDWVSTTIPFWVIPVAMCVIGAFMSLFASTLGVVTPALFPIVPAIAVATGYNPTVLFVCIVVGAQASAISPFSSGGSLILGSTPQGVNQSQLFNDLLFRAVPLGFIAALLAAVVVQGVL